VFEIVLIKFGQHFSKQHFKNILKKIKAGLVEAVQFWLQFVHAPLLVSFCSVLCICPVNQRPFNHTKPRIQKQNLASTLVSGYCTKIQEIGSSWHKLSSEIGPATLNP